MSSVAHPRSLTLLALAVLGAGCRRPSPATATAPSEDPVVATASGPVRGRTLEGGVRAFLGVPYAAPPTGGRRFRAPEPPAPWTTPRDASRVGPACPQLRPPPYATTSEDCLTVNVWSPSGPAGKPVLLFLPGGAFVEGSGGYQLYDGARLAARVDAVVITMNYRVGPLGFMGHPDLAREAGLHATPSFGLLDQQAALAWVRKNVHRFGGNPEAVTLFGQSAGAFSACAHLVMPDSRGLFQRAVLQSGACSGPLWIGPREAEVQGEKLAAALGCQDLACLRAAPVEQVLSALPLKKRYLLPPGVWWGPVVDGETLPFVPREALRRGMGAPIPLIVGWNRDEGTAHTFGAATVSDEDRDSFVRDSWGSAAVQPIAERYARPTTKASLTDIVTDGAFACEARRLARAHAARGNAVYAYELTHTLDAPAFHPLGATHNVELFLLFGNEEAGIRLSAAELPFSALVMDAWGRFARHGDPNGPTTSWPRYDDAKDRLLLLDLPLATASGVKRADCDFWDGIARTLE